MPVRVGLGAVLGLFIGLATLYNVANPLFEAPDEIWHYLFVKHVRETWQLPVQAPTRGEVFSQQEAGQAPLYYVLGAALTFWIPGRPAEEWLRPNEHASIGAPWSEDNKNRFVHGPGEAFPYSGDFLVAHLLRFLSTLFGAGTVLFTYLLGRELWPARPALALGAASLNAFIPQFLYISAAINNDLSVAFFCSATLWLAARLVRSPAVTARQVAALGGLGGLAIMAKSAALTTIPLIVLTLAFIAWRRRSLRFALWSLPLALFACVLLTGWWFARNVVRYGELLPLKTFLDRASLDDQIPTLAEVINDLAGLRASFWALFGWFNILVDGRLYLFFDVILLLAAAGLALLALDSRRRATVPLSTLSLVVGWAVIVAAALLRYRLIVQAFQGRLLFPAIAPVALLVVLGWSGLWPRRLASIPSAAVGLAMLAIAALVPFTYILPSYARPAPVHESDVKADARKSGALLGTEVQLLAYRLSPGSLVPGQALDITLYWQAREAIRRDYSVFVHLLDWRGRTRAQKDTFPGGGRNATSLWAPGEIIRDTYRLGVPAELPTPSILRVETGLYRAATMERLPVRFADGASGASVPLGVIRALRPLADQVAIERPVDVVFADRATLVGYRVANPGLVPGQRLSGELYWQAKGGLDKDLTVFVQLLGPAGLVAQHDAQPLDGAFPTSVWEAGDQITHPFDMAIPATLPPGRYRLIAGLYDHTTGARLATPDGDYADLGLFDVLTPSTR